MRSVAVRRIVKNVRHLIFHYDGVLKIKIRFPGIEGEIDLFFQRRPGLLPLAVNPQLDLIGADVRSRFEQIGAGYRIFGFNIHSESV